MTIVNRCSFNHYLEFIGPLCMLDALVGQLPYEAERSNSHFFAYRHDVCAIAGFTAMSFGDEDVDRYIVVYKKDFGPSEDEVFARRNGQQWNAETAKEYAQKVCKPILHTCKIGH